MQSDDAAPATPEAPIYTPADVEALSAANNEPEWLRESRHVAWELYEMLPMPGRTDEEWRRTDYRSIRWDEASPLVTAPMVRRSTLCPRKRSNR